MSLSASTSSSTEIDLEKQSVPPHYEDLIELPSILKESITGFGGFGALLLQIAHPGVARGVNNHSEFATRQLDRAEKTAIYVYMMVYGSEEEKSFIREWVNKMHSRVKGGEGDTKYHAQDPDLQLWVAATLYVGWVKSYEMAFGQIEGDRAERLYQEFAVFGTSLQVPRSKWPRNREAFWEYYDRIVERELRIVPEGEQVYHHIMHPNLPWAFTPFIPLTMYLMRILSVDYLPPEVKSTYRLKPLSGFDKAMRKMFVVQYRLMPGFVRSLPKRYYMKRGKMMVAKLKERGYTGDMRMREN
ncbi:hypothetical protein BDW66DRAFT_166673 [Aspergillus desertorum]